jgi:NAD(P)H-dependent FMN reductase
MSVSDEWLDLGNHSIPLCDSDAKHNNSKVKKIRDIIQNANVILLAGPIHNYDVNAAAKILDRINW